LRDRRAAQRYALAPGLEAVVDDVGVVRLVDLSSRGARIAHGGSVQHGARVRLRFATNNSSVSFHATGRVVWTSEGSGESGIEFEHEASAVKNAIDQLAQSGRARKI
jgi:hypothetical protein